MSLAASHPVLFMAALVIALGAHALLVVLRDYFDTDPPPPRFRGAAPTERTRP